MRHLRLLAALCLLCPLLAMAQIDTGGGSSTGTFVAPGLGTSSVPGPAGAPGVLPGGTTSDMGAGLRQPALVTPIFPTELPERRFAPRIEPLPPAKPSEFQKFVEEATGRLLPVFGANFFANPLVANEPLDNVPVTADYVIGPGDELVIRAWG
ncbi:MAG TPA: hypothetical protein VFZ93_15245, partial [Albitalea sp.]